MNSYCCARYYDTAGGRFLSEDPFRFGGGVDFYSYVGNSPTNWLDPFGLQHIPGGPWHPDPWIQYGCTWVDDCSTLSWKIDTFKKVIAAHIEWDVAHNTNFHSQTDIPQLSNGLRNCITIHQTKCTNKCPKFEPIPVPAPTPEQKKAIQGTTAAAEVATGIAIILYYIYSAVWGGS